MFNVTLCQSHVTGETLTFNLKNKYDMPLAFYTTDIVATWTYAKHLFYMYIDGNTGST